MTHCIDTNTVKCRYIMNKVKYGGKRSIGLPKSMRVIQLQLS